MNELQPGITWQMHNAERHGNKEIGSSIGGHICKSSPSVQDHKEVKNMSLGSLLAKGIGKRKIALFAPWPWQQQVGGTASCSNYGKLENLTKVASKLPLGPNFLSKQAGSLWGG